MGDEYRELREAAERATPGPWAHSTVLHGHVYHQGVDVAVGNPKDATYIAAADPPTILALLDRLKVAEAKVARVSALVRDLDQRVEDSGFNPTDILLCKTVSAAERQGYLDGVRTVVTNVSIALESTGGDDAGGLVAQAGAGDEVLPQVREDGSLVPPETARVVNATLRGER